MAFTTTEASTNTSNKRKTPKKRSKRSISDRTPEETISLIRDIINSVLQTGPRAGSARTIQASLALSQTLNELLPSILLSATRRENAEELSGPVVLRKLFERLGATYIKLGQFIASSPTLFPPEYVLEFQKCLDATEPLEWNIIKNVIEKEIGPISKTFTTVDKTPLASASIAQVHTAKLLTGEEVVLKVQKPNIDQSLLADLNFIYIASRILEFIQPDYERLSLSGVAFDIKTSMLEELDFVKESQNVEEFRKFLKEQGLVGRATAPRIYSKYTTKKLLTMERLDGVSLLNIDQISQFANPESTIINALNVWTTSVLTMPFFHADVHAGNLLVLPDGRVGFIDFGIVGRVNEKTFDAVQELSTSMVQGDYLGMAQALSNMGAADDKVDLEGFAEDIERVMVDLSRVQADVSLYATEDGTGVNGMMSLDENDVTQVLLDIVNVTENNGLKLPREFGLLVKQSLYFDRYLKILAPDLDVMNDARVGLGTSSGDANGLPQEDKVIDI